MGSSYSIAFQPEEAPTPAAPGGPDARNRLSEIAATARIGIDPRTGLATDFLNPYNEIAMLLGLVADDVTMVSDVEDWSPTGYVEHFEASGFSDRALAIEAYQIAPPAVRARFEAVAHDLDSVLLEGLAFLRQCRQAEAWSLIGPSAAALAEDARLYLHRLDALIHGGSLRPAQAEVDNLLASKKS